ncbi:MAG: 2-oxoacid:acceptor oxidoreductase family protein [Dissulfurispiraceae bacterium]|jgi:2-oxoglutarate ferredoxin oxidoreductase subunit gamma|nr:2-oxoacid:acceptor oxidoreductase family protein [Dissulfurispiraceae bacterium]
MTKRIIIAGSGGQGVLFLGRLLAYTAMLENNEVTWFPSYGAEMRGGTANCTVVISDDIIGSPVVRNPDILITLNEASYKKFAPTVTPEGLVLYDSSINISQNSVAAKLQSVDATALAASLNAPGSANMAMVGACAASGIVSLDAAFRALEAVTPARRKSSLELNKKIITIVYEKTKS